MDTSDPWIEFDSDGICNHCTTFFYRYSLRVTPNLDTGSEALDQLFDQIRARKTIKKSGYDAIMGISGGTDSSFCALLASKAGLRILAVHLDNGWDTPSALSNVYQIANLPNVDYVSDVLDWNQFCTVQRSFLEAGVPDIELPTDIAIYKAVFKTAMKYNINTSISGGNISNEGILPACWMYNPRDMKYASSISVLGKVSGLAFNQVRFGFRDEVYHRLFRKFITFYPLDRINYDKGAAAKILERDLGWSSHGHKHSESTYTRFCQLIYQPNRHGFEYRRAHLSSDICMNRISRIDALRELAQPAMSRLEIECDISFVANKLGYSIENLVALMHQPPMWFVDYPNRRRFLGLAYGLYRTLKGQPKLSNY